MKIRNGFVSNSSSSSFIVNREKLHLVPHSYDKGRMQIKYDVILTETQEQDLVEFGFHKHVCGETTDYTFKVCCNQKCVMKYLIEHNIPFRACCHYEQEHYFWDGKSDNLIFLRNFGQEYDMYKKDAEKLFDEKAGYYVPVTSMTKCDTSNCDSKYCIRGWII